MRLGSRQVLFLCFGLLVLATGPIARGLAMEPPASINRASLPAISGCVRLDGWSIDWAPTFIGADYSAADSYQCDGYRLHVSVSQYVEQHQGKEAVGEFNSVIPRSWWNATTRARRFVEPDLEVDEYRVDRTPQQLTIWNWYAVGVQPASSAFSTKAIEALNALRLKARVTTNITVALEADPGFDASKHLEAETTDIWNWFQAEMRSDG